MFYNSEAQAVEPLGDGVLRTQTASQEDEFVRSLVIRNPVLKPSEVQDFLLRWEEKGKDTNLASYLEGVNLVGFNAERNAVVLPKGKGKAMVALRTGQPDSDGGIRYDRLFISVDLERLAEMKDCLTLILSTYPDEIQYLVVTASEGLRFLPVIDVAALVPVKERIYEEPTTNPSNRTAISQALAAGFRH